MRGASPNDGISKATRWEEKAKDCAYRTTANRLNHQPTKGPTTSRDCPQQRRLRWRLSIQKVSLSGADHRIECARSLYLILNINILRSFQERRRKEPNVRPIPLPWWGGISFDAVVAGYPTITTSAVPVVDFSRQWPFSEENRLLPSRQNIFACDRQKRLNLCCLYKCLLL